MPVTPQQIAAAADALALQRLQATMQMESAADTAQYRAAEAADRKRSLELHQRLVEASDEAVAAMPTRAEQLFVQLYTANLNARRTAITSSTTDAVIDDIAADAMRMTVAVFPSAQAALGLA